MNAVVKPSNVEIMPLAVEKLAELTAEEFIARRGGVSKISIERNRSAYAGMRVVFVNRYYFPDLSATSQMLFDLTRRLAREGMEVSVICSQQLYDDAQAKLPASEVVEGVRVHRVSTTRFGRNRLLGRAFDYASFYISATAKLLEVVQGGDVIVAKTDPPLISLAAAVVAKWRGAKLINWLQDLFPEVASHLGQKRLPEWFDAYLRRLRDQSLRMAHTNVVIGNRMREHLLQRRISTDRIRVIENWADADFVQSIPTSASELRASLGLQGKFVVAYSGNLGRAHEYETILRAAVALRHESDVVFLMIGGGVKMQQLKQAAAAQLLDNFIFLPYQPREALSDCLAAADVHLACLLPSLEGLIVPSKFYGILAAGRPTIFIGDPDGELSRILRTERCGKVVGTGDFDTLIAEIWRMKVDVEYRNSAGLRARALFLERYTATRGAERWMEVFERIRVEESDRTMGVAAPLRA